MATVEKIIEKGQVVGSYDWKKRICEMYGLQSDTVLTFEKICEEIKVLAKAQK